MDDQIFGNIISAKKKFIKTFFDVKWGKYSEWIKEAESLVPTYDTFLNLVGIGIGPKIINGIFTEELSIRVYVAQKVNDPKKIPENLLIPSEYEGYHTDIIEVGYLTPHMFDRYMRPIFAGASIGNENENSAGTFGGLVKAYDETFILSCNHVIARNNQAVTGENIVHPGRLDGGNETVARLHRFVEIIFDGVTPNLVDVAIGRPLERGLFKKQIIKPRISPRGIGEADYFKWVMKCGRTTERTRGYIFDIHYTSNIHYPQGYARFDDQILIKGVVPRGFSSMPDARYVPPFSSNGDSGALVIDEKTNLIYGLLIAGNSSNNFTIVNKIANIENELRVNVA